MPITGFVFDFDGLILDTEIPQFTAWQEVFSLHGFPLTYRDWWKTIGTGPSAYNPSLHLYELTGGKIDIKEVKSKISDRIQELMEASRPLPGVEEFITLAYVQNIPMAVASSSDREWVITNLQKYGLRQYFKFVFCAEDVAEVKPNPALYQLALKALNLSPENALAFEDSPNGIKAAKSAGMTCYAIPNLITREMDLTLADAIYSSFTQFHPSDFLA